VRVRFRLEAAEDVEAARAWYEEQRAGLGIDFVESLEKAIELIVRFPTAFPQVTATYRRALLHRFPYALYYRVDDDVVDVLACLHNARAPDAWHSRE